jgi:hypothetical protein
MPLDPQRLLELFQKTHEELLPLECWDLYEYLGNFIPLWFRPEVVQRVEEETTVRFEKPQLPQERGSCWIIFALGLASQYPMLKPAFVLPLQWQCQPEHDRRLPARLKELADRVRRALNQAYRDEEYLRWRLYMHPNFAISETTPDFSGLDEQLRFESGWLALAGGLYLARHNGQPSEHVWASARWDEEKGILRVGHLVEKLELAQEYGVRQFYIPDEQINEVPELFQGMVKPIRQGTNRLQEVLDNYVYALDVRPACPPSNEESFQRCRDWYLRQPSPDLRYYCTCLLPYLLPRLQRQRRSDYADCQPEVLVTVLSHSWNLIPLIAHTFEVKRCVVLVTAGDERTHHYSEPVRQFLNAFERRVELIECEFYEERMEENFGALEIWEHYRQRPEKILVDMTPGKKLMTLHLYRSAPRGCWLVYVNTEQRQNRPVPGSEKLVCWQRD